MPAESVVGAVAVGTMEAVVAGVGAGIMSMSALSGRQRGHHGRQCREGRRSGLSPRKVKGDD